MPAGDELTRPGRRADVLVARDELVLFAFEMEPHTDGAGPHLHRAHVDSFYVLDGELEVTLAGDTRQLRPGELATVPPETVHAFRNASGAACASSTCTRRGCASTSTSAAWTRASVLRRPTTTRTTLSSRFTRAG